MDKEKLQECLELHRLWLKGDSMGARAYLRGADLRGADLRHAYLRGADLRHAYLRGADLRGADLRGADLRGAYLWGAYLRYADLWQANLQNADLRDVNLKHANLRYADLRYADLRYADLQEADLQEAKLDGVKVSCETSGFHTHCPEVGEFMAFKKCVNGDIVTLKIPEDAKRSSATTSKCRCDKAFVVAIEDRSGCAKAGTISRYDGSFIYKVGEMVRVGDFDDDRWNECSTGIHFFLTKKEAASF